MCGIVGYLGHRQAPPIIISGLKRLEYRGYDSSGVAFLNADTYHLFKVQGRVAELDKKLSLASVNSTTGMGHTRWATHGAPSEINAHPHVSNSGRIILIHNGIIENYEALKTMLLEKGYHFNSQTDTEVLANLIEYIQKSNGFLLSEATRVALTKVVGAYAIAVMEKGHESTIILAKLGSPLAVGIGKKEFFFASDASPFIEYTRNVLYLKDGQMALLQKGSLEVDLRIIANNHKENPIIEEIKFNLAQIEKGGFDHFMLKEIYEQPRSVLDTLRGRLLPNQGVISMSGTENHKERFLRAKRIIIIACGTSWHAGLIGEYLFEELARLPVEVEYASEFRYRNPILYSDDIIIAMSQSGETADTLAALKLAREKGGFIFGICNVVGSSIARFADAGAYTHAGPEIGVASTKSFTTQVSVLTLLALKLGKQRGVLQENHYRRLCEELNLIPEVLKETLDLNEQIKKIAQVYKGSNNFLYLGRGFNFPVALEGALKLKEISYVHAEGYPAAEMKHGPIALIDENMPVVVIATKRGHYEKIMSNIQEIKARKGKIIAIVNQLDPHMERLADHVIQIPDTSEELSPLISIVPLQLLAYHIALMRGANVDQPRNLAKSVTVE